MSTSITRVPNVEIVPTGVTALSQATSMEATIAAAVEAQSRAVVQARYALAMKNPRDMDEFRARILKECNRPGFAKVARYAKKQGKKKDPETNKMVDNYVVGPSIRFAEAALRCFTNVLEEEAVIHDDDQRRVMRVSATDLENNLTYSADVVIIKQVERKFTEGREPVSSRKNSYGDTTYTLWATDEETLQKQASMISKALRKQVLRMLPGDIVEECMEQVLKTQACVDKADPDSQRNALFDVFGALGVSPIDIKEYLGHDIGLEDLPLLRAIYQTLKQGDAKWSQLMAEKKAEDEGAEQPGDLMSKIKAKAEEAEKKRAQPKKPESAPPQAEVGAAAAAAPVQEQTELPRPVHPLFAKLEAAKSVKETEALNDDAQATFTGEDLYAWNRAYIERGDALKAKK
jgi:hypothetical protein